MDGMENSLQMGLQITNYQVIQPQWPNLIPKRWRSLNLTI